MGENNVDYIDELNVLHGFKFLQAYEAPARDENGKVNDYTIVFKFANDKGVAIELTIIDGECNLGEPYAVNKDFEPITT